MTFWEQSGPLGDLHELEVFEFYDQPVLLSCRSESGSLYLIVLVDADGGDEEWLCAGASPHRLKDVRSGVIDLRTAFSSTEDGRIYVVSYPASGQARFRSMLSRQVPDKFLPTAGAKLDIRPEATS